MSWHAGIVGTVNYAEQGAMRHKLKDVKRVKIIRFKAPLFFANAKQLQDSIEEMVRLRDDPMAGLTELWTALVIDFGAVEWVDTTSIDIFREIMAYLTARDIPLGLARVSNRVVTTMGRANIRLGDEVPIFPSVHHAVKSVLRDGGWERQKSASAGKGAKETSLA